MLLKTLETWFIWLIMYSVMGWIYESILCSVRSRKFINRGFLNGPYCPIYGSGALLIVLVLGRIRDPIILYILGAVLTCSLEYLTSYVMEKLFHARWWDYTNRRFNINGRVCLIGAVVFGAFSVRVVLVVHPFVVSTVDMLSDIARHIIALSLFAIFMLDCIVTIAGFSGFHKKMEELYAFWEQRKVSASSRIQSSDAYKEIKELSDAVKSKLNIQQLRMISVFPALKLKKPKYDSALQKLRELLESSRALKRRRRKKADMQDKNSDNCDSLENKINANDRN